MIEVKQITTPLTGSTPTREERETVIVFNELPEEPATVFTYNPALIRKLDALTDSRPAEVSCTRAEAVNGVQLREYTIPKRWIKVNPSRILTEEEKTKWAKRFMPKNTA